MLLLIPAVCAVVSVALYSISYALLTLLCGTVAAEKREAISHVICVLFFLGVIAWLLTR